MCYVCLLMYICACSFIWRKSKVMATNLYLKTFTQIIVKNLERNICIVKNINKAPKVLPSNIEIYGKQKNIFFLLTSRVSLSTFESTNENKPENWVQKVYKQCRIEPRECLNMSFLCLLLRFIYFKICIFSVLFFFSICVHILCSL